MSENEEQERKIIKFGATWTSISRTKDRGATARLSSSTELSSELFYEIDKLLEAGQGCNGWFIFIPDAVDDEDILNFKAPKENAPRERGVKSESELLYNSLFALWMKLGGEESGFEQYRRRRMAMFRSDVIAEIRELEDKARY